jgi:hypothetical protein
MTPITTGAKRAIDRKEQNYPIISYCVKVGAFWGCTSAFCGLVEMASLSHIARMNFSFSY